jgi:hypothetical protein
MQDDISKEHLALFSLIVQNLGTVLKNIVIYPALHPISQLSIKNLKNSLDKWFLERERLDLGVSPESVLLNGNFVDKKNLLYRELASRLHGYGLSAVAFKKGLELKELEDMFRFLKEEAGAKKEGVTGVIPDLCHITIKAVDYSSVLKGDNGGISAEEDLWRTLADISEESCQGKLPEEREEFISNFLKDPKRSAVVLNKIYRDAVSKLDGEGTVVQTREVIARICDYMANNPGALGNSTREDIGELISRLDADLVAKLFRPDTVNGRDFDLALEVMRDVPDEFIAGFIGSLVRSNGGFNENIFKVLDKISPGGSRDGKIAALVAEKISGDRTITPEVLAEMQTTIGEVFSAHAESGFMSQMYNLAVNTFIDRKAFKIKLPRELSVMAEEYKMTALAGRAKKYETELILNLMWDETDPGAFSGLCARLAGILPELLESAYIDSIKDVFSFFFTEINPENRENPEMAGLIDDFKNMLRDDAALARLIKLLAGSDEKNARDIALMLEQVRTPKVLNMVIDEFYREEKEGRKKNLSLVLENMSPEEAEIVFGRIRQADGRASRELFNVLKRIFPRESRRFAAELISSGGSSGVKTDIIADFVPENEAERDMIKNILRNETDPVFRRKAIEALFKTMDKAAVKDLFRIASRGGYKSEFLKEVIEMSGEFNSQEAVPLLSQILRRSDIFRRNEKVRMAAVVALGRIRNAEAVEAIREALGKSSKAVADICGMILSLENRGSGEKGNDGDASYGNKG